MGNTCWLLVILLSAAAVTHRNGGCWTRGSDESEQIQISQVTHYNCTRENFGDLSPENFDPNRTHLSLIHLVLSKNRIRSVKHDVFHHLNKLQYLVLSENLISSLDERVFSNLKSLRHLDLSINLLSSLPDSLFSSQEHLQTLLLGGNKLITVSVRLLTPLQTIKLLDLSKNPFVCNCSLRLAVIWCQDKMLDTRATCQNELSGNEYIWTQPESFNNCSENDSKLSNSDDATFAVASSYLVPVIIVGAVILQFTCFGLFLLYVRRKRRSSVFTAGQSRSVAFDSTENHEYQYDYIHFPDIYKRPQVLNRTLRTPGNMGHVQVGTYYGGLRLKKPALSGTNKYGVCCVEGHQITKPECKNSQHNSHEAIRSGIISTSVSNNLPEQENPSRMATHNVNISNNSSDSDVVVENSLYSAVDLQK